MRILPAQIKAARALLVMSQQELAKRAEVSLPTIKRCESELSTVANVADDTRQSIIKTLEAAGIEFTNGDAPGVRLVGAKKPRARR